MEFRRQPRLAVTVPTRCVWCNGAPRESHSASCTVDAVPCESYRDSSHGGRLGVMGSNTHSNTGTDKGPGRFVARLTLGRQLKRHRELAGKSAADFVQARIGSAAKMYRIEAGKSPVRVLDVKEMCAIYDVDAATRTKLMQLAEFTDGSSWWEPYGAVIPDWFETLVDLEAHARELRTYESELVPGLLQTPDYHRAIFDADPLLDPARAVSTIAFRADRQRTALEAADPLRINAVLNEAVLAREVGGRRVMVQQREQLLKMSRRPNIDIQILPWSAGAHAAMRGTFTVVVPRDQDDPDVVYVETRAGGRYMQEEPILLAYRADFESIRSSAIPIEEYLKK
jgi:hypothetical protein